MIKVLFVCLGNICRSPMAEAVFMHKVRNAGLADQISADSAGTGDWHVGDPPHTGTRKILRDKGIDYDHVGRTLNLSDYDDFDLILTMDEDNFRTVNRRGKGTAEVRRFLEFAPKSSYTEMPDPWYSGDFQLTYDLVNQASDGLLQYLKSRYL